MLIDQPFYSFLPTLKGIKHIQTVSQNPGVIESDQGMQGILIKGVSSDFNPSFFQEKLVEGYLNIDSLENGIVVGKGLASKMDLHLGDRILVNYIINDGNLRTRRHTIQGIYNTGLEELDTKVVFTHLSNIQKINRWGLEAVLSIQENKGNTYLQAKAFGGRPPYRFEWLNPPLGSTQIDETPICITENNLFQIVVNDAVGTIADTAWLQVSPKIFTNNCLTKDDFTEELYTSKGSNHFYTNGFEVFLNNIDLVDEMDFVIYNNLPQNLKTLSIFELFPEIFNWLEMLDLNVVIIIILMVVVAVINMVSALLVLILEKIKTIGILKAMGANNLAIRKIFLFQGGFIVLSGMLFGNILAILIMLLQNTFSLIELNPETYYIDKIPLLISIKHFAFVNSLTLLASILALVLPTFLISRLKPSSSIRYT
jgi:lipoprotein-releasing system permease protein